MHKHGQEELPRVPGQKQKLGGPHAPGVAAKRSYPASEVRGSGQEGLPHVQGQGQRPRVPGCNSVGQLRGATPRLRPEAAARSSNPMFKERWLHGCRRA